MALAEYIDASVSLLGKTSGELTLRVCRGGRAQQIVRVASQKCSVGSSADCTLQLHDAGIQPHHFVILRGQRHTIVRRLDGKALLNNRPFEDASLVSGDWLTLGDLQVQVLTPDAPAASRKAGSAWDEPEINKSSPRPMDAAELATLRARLSLANGQGRERVRRLVERLRKLQRRFNDLESRRQQQASEARELDKRLHTWNAERAELDAHRLEIERNQQAFVNSRTNWLAETLKREQQLAAREEALASQSNQLRQNAAALAAERVTLLAEQDKHLSDHQLRMAAHGEREQAVAEQAAGLETARQQHAQARLQSESERREAEARVAMQEAALAARLRQVESQRTSLDARERELQTTAGALQAAQRQLDEQRARWEAESSAEQSRLDRAAREMNEKLTALELRWREAADLTRDLTARQAVVDASEQQLREAQASWAADRRTSETDLQQQLRQLADQHATLARQRDQAEQCSADLDRQRDSLQQEAAQLESLRAEFAVERERWEAERTTTLARLALRTEEVDRLSQELDERARQAATAQQPGAGEQAAEAAYAAAQAELATRTAEFERDRKAFEQAQATWEAQRSTIERADDKLQHASEDATRLATLTRELEESRQELAATTRLLEEARLAWESEPVRRRERLQAAQSDLAAERAEGENLQHLSKDAEVLAARTRELEVLQQELVAKAKQLDEARLAWEAEQVHEQERLQSTHNELAAEHARLEQARAELGACAAQLEEARQSFEREQSTRQAEMAAISDVHAESSRQQFVADQAAYDARQNELDAAYQSLATDRQAVEADRQALAAEQQRFADAGRSNDEQLAALRERLEHLQADQEAERCRYGQLVKQLEEQQTELTAQQRQDENARAASAAEHDRQEAELAAGRDALAAAQAAFEVEQLQTREELAVLAAQHTEQTAEIERLQHELAEERQAFRDRREQIEQKLQERTEDLERRWAELQSRQVEFDAWRESQEAALLQQREASPRDDDHGEVRETTPVEEPRSEEPRTPSAGRSTQLSSLALLTKMGLAVPSDEEHDQAPVPEAKAPPPAAKPRLAVQAAPAEEEDDIDAYMARLLDRVGGRAAPASAAPRTPPAPSVQAASPAPEPPMPPAAEAVPTDLPKRPERAMAPRALPPELSADLSAMREVANANARSAIKTHMHRTVSKERLKRMSACVIMLLVCGALIWRHFEGLPWMLEAAGLVGLLAVVMGTSQLYAMHKFRKTQAELDAQRGAACPVPAQRAEQGRPNPFAESATDEAESAGAET